MRSAPPTPRETGGSRLRHLNPRALVSSRALLVGGVALLCVGGALALRGADAPKLAVATPANARVPAAQAQRLPAGFAPPAATPAPVTKAHSAPVEVAIPAIAVRSPLVRLGLNSNGTLQVPTDFAKAGWYSGGPAPGDAGVSVIAGHVDSHAGPAVFYRLPALRVGDVVLVRGADGTTARFTVYKMARYLKTAFPAAQVYANTARPELRLITCTGDFNRSTGHYLSNFVAYATEQPAVPKATAHPSARPSATASAGAPSPPRDQRHGPA
jgi:sortase (surface protein transpeptidase)